VKITVFDENSDHSIYPRENIFFKDATITKGPFTIFAPTEAAFGKLISRDPREYNSVLLKDKNLLARILLQHVVPGKLGLSDLVSILLISISDEKFLDISFP
jgi:uncharacterized surface protein with fasciclin (FAS1) repeats